MRFLSVYIGYFFKNKSIMLSLILMPIIVYFAVFSKSENISVGLYFYSNETLKIQEKLLENEQINFVLVEDEEELKNLVISKDIVVGYIFKDNFMENLAKKNTAKLIDVIRLSDESYSKFIQPIIISAVYNEFSSYIVSDFLENKGILYQNDEIQKNIDKYKNQADSFKIYIEDIQSKQESSEVEMNINISKGIILIFLLIYSIITMIFCSEIEKNNILYIYDKKVQIYIAIPLYILSTAFAILSAITLKIASVNVDLSTEITKILILQVYLFIFTVIISKIIKKDILILSIPFLIIFIITTHPIFIDITIFAPKIKDLLKILPSYQYMM